MSSGYLDKIRKSNNYSENGKYPLVIDGKRVGQINKNFINDILNIGSFEERKGEIRFSKNCDTVDKREEAFNRLALRLEKRGIVKKENILYPITIKSFDDKLLLVDKSLLKIVGIISYSQHLIAYVDSENGVKVWIYKDNGEYRNIVEGALTWGLSLEENIIKLSKVSASITRSIFKNSTQFGSVSYCKEDKIGGQKEIIYSHKLRLPDDFKLEDIDGNSEKFILMDINEVAEIVRDSDKFKVGSNLVFIHFLISRGIINGSDKEFLDIQNSLNCNKIKYG